jgi:hypothetical protein
MRIVVHGSNEGGYRFPPCVLGEDEIMAGSGVSGAPKAISLPAPAAVQVIRPETVSELDSEDWTDAGALAPAPVPVAENIPEGPEAQDE